MSKSKIQWTEYTWNPISGCRRKGQGCLNCYAERVAHRLGSNPNEKIQALYSGLTQITNGRPGWTGEIGFSETALLEPLKRRKPTRYFISLSDLFYDKRPDEDIDRVFAVMALCPQHEFVVLTKYVERAGKWFADARGHHCVEYVGINTGNVRSASWLDPLDNVTLGVSISTQAEADALIPVLRRIPAARRIVSAEPLIENINLEWPKTLYQKGPQTCCNGHDCGCMGMPVDPPLFYGLDGVIVGGESGPGARPCDVAWIRSLVAQCKRWNRPVFVKQLGADAREGNANGNCRNVECTHPDCGYIRLSLNDRKGGDWSEWPEDLRVREWPEAEDV